MCWKIRLTMIKRIPILYLSKRNKKEESIC